VVYGANTCVLFWVGGDRHRPPRTPPDAGSMIMLLAAVGGLYEVASSRRSFRCQEH
jgi:hypothetical protein